MLIFEEDDADVLFKQYDRSHNKYCIQKLNTIVSYDMIRKCYILEGTASHDMIMSSITARTYRILEATRNLEK